MAKEYTQLTEKERYHLELLLQGSNSYSQNEIARILGRAKSTISGEIKRNKDKDGKYRSEVASALAVNRRKRETPTKFIDIAKNVIEDKLNRNEKCSCWQLFEMPGSDKYTNSRQWWRIRFT